jgi:hypothetical protein
MKKNLRILTAFLLLVLHVKATASVPSPERVASVSPASREEPLAAPFFTGQAFPVYENEIIWSYQNRNEDSETEIYISLSPTEGFTLTHVAAAGEEVYYDDTRRPRTTFYFKLRAIRGDEASVFSDVRAFTTGSKFYPPTLTAVATGPHTIELRLHDRSYNDRSYDLWRDQGPEPSFLKNIVATDSGRLIIYIDNVLAPGTDYSYRVDAHTQGPNNPIHFGVATASATTFALPEITGFTLIDADTDEDVRPIYDQDEFEAPIRPNIRADATDNTGSVVFYLNGRKRIENQAPYSYFYDINGNYSAGRLDNGHYTLEATAYSGNNGGGIKGTTLTVTFTVVSEGITGFTLVNASTDQDVMELQDGDTIPAGSAWNIRANADQKTRSVEFFLNGIRRLENQEPFAYFGDNQGDYRAGTLQPGEYTLSATPYSNNNAGGFAGETRSVSFVVRSANHTLQNAVAAANAITLYPNPVIDVARIEIDDQPGSMIHLHIVDQQGSAQGISVKDCIGSSGTYRNEFDMTKLRKGTYLMIVRVNERVVTRHFTVTR